MAVTLDPISAEARSRIASNASSESPAKFVAEGAIDLRMLIGHCQTVSAADSVEHVFDAFRQSDLEFLAIVDGERLLGMCSRHAIDSLLGGRYGFSLRARKAIAEHVAPNETRIVVSSAITDVLRKVFARNPENFYDDVLLVDEDGRLLGLISTETYIAAGLVGGDFFHIVRLSDSAASVFICDVMGHGVSSALITAMLRALIEGCGADAADPSVLMTHLNSEFTKILRQTDTVLFATAFYCVLDADRGELRYARAGHPYPFHVQRRGGRVALLNCVEGTAGPALGLIESASYGNSGVPLEPGDWVFLFTDGIEEATNHAGGEFGISGLAGVLQANLERPASEVLDELLAEVSRFTGGASFVDDICLVAAEVPL